MNLILWVHSALAIVLLAGARPDPHDTEHITNGSFDRGIYGWADFVSDRPANRLVVEGPADDRRNPGAHIAIRSVSGRPPKWHTNLVQANQALQKLKPRSTYVLRFRARASSPRRLQVALAQTFKPHRNLGLDAEVLLDSELRAYDVQFRTDSIIPAPGPTSSGAWLSFFADTLPGETWIDDVSLRLASPAVGLNAGRTEQLATFERNEGWQANHPLRPVTLADGESGLEVLVAANGLAFVSRERSLRLPDTAWDLELRVHCEAPETIGRISVMARSGEDRGLDDTIVSTSGLQRGWNTLRFPRERFYRHWFSGFRWDQVRTLAVRIEANANGPARIVLGEVRVVPRPAGALPPVLRFVGVERVTPRWAFVVCETDVPVAAEVHFGPGVAYGRTVAARAKARRHRLRLDDLEPGTLQHVRVFVDGGVSSGDLAFLTPPDRPPLPAPEQDPKFDVGLYGANQLDDLRRAAGSAFDCFQSYQLASPAHNTTADVVRYVATAESLGTRVIVGFEVARINEGDLDYVRERVRTLKDRPGVRGWYLYDEPEMHSVEPATLKACYREIKQVDPQHPVYIATSWLDADYPHRGAFDVAILDKFPIPYAGPDAILPSLEQARRSGEWFQFVFQAYSVDLDHRWPATGAGPGRFPTRDEMRVMAYLAINRGAAGLWAFSYDYLHFTSGADWKWVELTDIARELRALAPVLASRDRPRRKSSNPPRELDVALKSYRGEDYVITVNKSASPVSATVALPGAALTSVERVDQAPDAGTARVDAGGIADQWQPRAVHVYRVR